MTTLVPIPAHQIDFAWRDGASSLHESCSVECTVDQLKYALALGERQLVRLDDEGKTVGWAVFRVEQQPNMRVFFITNLVGRGCGFHRFGDELKKLASTLGCSTVRCCAKKAQSRLYQMKLGMKPIYEILDMEV